MYDAVVTFQVVVISRFTLHNRRYTAGLKLETFARADACNYSHFSSLLRLMSSSRNFAQERGGMGGGGGEGGSGQEKSKGKFKIPGKQNISTNYVSDYHINYQFTVCCSHV